jgi:hypothetical protein
MLQEKAEVEFGRLGRDGGSGREFLDMNSVIRLLKLREAGTSARDIESQLDLKPGVLAKLGPPGIAVPVNGGTR